MHRPGPDPRDVAIANAVIGAAVLGAAWLVLRSPVARRLAWGGVRLAVTTWLPAYVGSQVSEAWSAAIPPRLADASAQAAPEVPAVAALPPPRG